MKSVQGVILISYLILLCSCGIEKNVTYVSKDNDYENLGKDAFYSSLHFDNLQQEKFRFSLFVRPLSGDTILIKRISVGLKSKKGQDSILYDLKNIEIVKYRHLKPTTYNFFNELNSINDTLRIIEGGSSTTTFYFNYKDNKIKKQKKLELNIEFIVWVNCLTKELTIRKKIFLERKNEYSFWILRNC